jgi:hypothetical protein
VQARAGCKKQAESWLQRLKLKSNSVKQLNQVTLQEADERKEKFATLILFNRHKDFWSEIQKISKSGNTSCTIDDITSVHDISTLFADRHTGYCNSVSFKVCDITLTEVNLVHKITSSSSTNVFVKLWD